jgi:hypothetical protein
MCENIEYGSYGIGSASKASNEASLAGFNIAQSALRSIGGTSGGIDTVCVSLSSLACVASLFDISDESLLSCAVEEGGFPMLMLQSK